MSETFDVYSFNNGNSTVYYLKPSAVLSIKSGILWVVHYQSCCINSPELHNICHPNPCQNGGSCIRVGLNKRKCTCLEQYSGINCERKYQTGSKLWKWINNNDDERRDTNWHLRSFSSSLPSSSSSSSLTSTVYHHYGRRKFASLRNWKLLTKNILEVDIAQYE